MAKLSVPVGKKDYIKGDADAAVTLVELVEYGDFECPYCGKAYIVMKVIKKTVRRPH